MADARSEVRERAKPVTIIGIDPGLNATGYGVIAVDGGAFRVIAADTIRTPATRPMATRLEVLYRTLAQVISTHHPTIAALEALFTHQQHVTTAALMAHARGVACLVSAQHRLQLVEYLPTRVKKALTGNGHASKEQVARSVGMWLGTSQRASSSDTTDALALAIAHAQISRVTTRLHLSGGRSARPIALGAGAIGG